MPVSPGPLVVLPLSTQDGLRGFMAITGEDVSAAEVFDALRTLGSQVALALEAARLAEDRLERRSQERFRSLVQNASDVIVIVGPDATISYASPSAARVLGHPAEALEGSVLTALIDDDDAGAARAYLAGAAAGTGVEGRVGWTLRHADGRAIQVEAVASNLLDDPAVGGLVVTMRDVSERFELESRLEHQAFHDPLTDLANRALFRDRVEHAIERGYRDRQSIAMLFLDLDDFKTVNDSLGHAAGDRMLVEVGTCLLACVPAVDTAARLGGDEFGILLEDVNGPERRSRSPSGCSATWPRRPG